MQATRALGIHKKDVARGELGVAAARAFTRKRHE